MYWLFLLLTISVTFIYGQDIKENRNQGNHSEPQSKNAPMVKEDGNQGNQSEPQPQPQSKNAAMGKDNGNEANQSKPQPQSKNAPSVKENHNQGYQSELKPELQSKNAAESVREVNVTAFEIMEERGRELTNLFQAGHTLIRNLLTTYFTDEFKRLDELAESMGDRIKAPEYSSMLFHKVQEFVTVLQQIESHLHGFEKDVYKSKFNIYVINNEARAKIDEILSLHPSGIPSRPFVN